MYKVFKETNKGNILVYTCENELDAVNVAIRNTESGKKAFVKDSFQHITYETFMMNDLDKVFA